MYLVDRVAGEVKKSNGDKFILTYAHAKRLIYLRRVFVNGFVADDHRKEVNENDHIAININKGELPYYV